LHPGGADSRAWAANLPPLAERLRVYAPDRRGHARTPDVAGPITFEAMARDAIAFVEALHAAPVDLVAAATARP
jgi:pimeloyl-ACP methyl ester carboxylesterase